MNLTALPKVLAGEPPYRYKQAQKALFQDLIDDWSKATNLSLSLREKLNEVCPLTIKAEKNISTKDGSIKALLELEDGNKIETVLLAHEKGRNTACVSSQVGCPLGCLFCATGQLGFKRNLTADEIVDQVLYFNRVLKKENKRVDNVVFMGMGEPFLNYDNVLSAIKILNDQNGLKIGSRHISISTIGVTEGIRKLAKERLEVNLAISLHAPDDKLRQQLMPAGKKYTIKKILPALGEYLEQKNRRVMLEYLMIKNFNDQIEHARALAKIAAEKLFFVNLISYNPTGGFQASDPLTIKTFKGYLRKKGVPTTQRYRFGGDIDAACGQLAGRKNNELPHRKRMGY